MSVSMADTAELPRVQPPALAAVSAEAPSVSVEAPAVSVEAPAVAASPVMPEWLEVAAPDAVADEERAPELAVVCDLPAPPRAMLRVERRRERRVRVWWVAVGLSAMVAMLGVTVAVLSMVR